MTAATRPELCVGAIAVRDDELLMIKRGTEPGLGMWSLPGGRVESGESMAEAVVREVAEETGLSVICDGLLGWVERVSDAHHFVIMDFEVTVMGAEPLSPGSDAADARWVPLWQVSELALVDGLLDFLADHKLIEML